MHNFPVFPSVDAFSDEDTTTVVEEAGLNTPVSEVPASEVPVLALINSPNLVVTRAQRLDQHPAAVYLASLSLRSRRTMRGDLNTIAGLLTAGSQDAMEIEWSQLRYSHCAAVRSALAERYAHSTANRMLSALRGVLKAAWRLGQLPTEEFHRAIDLPTVKGETLPRGRALSMGELRGVLGVCGDGSVIGARDQALLAVLYGCGLRRAEVVGLDVSDYEATSGELKVRAGKGNKQRLVYATSGVQIALERWLLLRGIWDGPLFVAVGKGVAPTGGKIGQTRLVDQTVMDILLRRAKQAGLKKTSPHDFRRTFISDLLDAGADIATVQKLAGHANVTTTARYDRRGEVAKQKAAHLLHVPVNEL